MAIPCARYVSRPVINENAVQTFQKAVRMGQKEGRVVLGGHRLMKGDFAHGNYVSPRLSMTLPRQSNFQEEFSCHSRLS